MYAKGERETETETGKEIKAKKQSGVRNAMRPSHLFLFLFLFLPLSLSLSLSDLGLGKPHCCKESFKAGFFVSPYCDNILIVNL